MQELAIGGATWRSPSGHLVAAIEWRKDWVADALQHIRRDPQGLPVLALPYLVLMKVESGRAQDLADAARMLGVASDWSVAGWRGPGCERDGRRCPYWIMH